MKLIKPNVADLIAALQKYPPDARVRMEDADTNWIFYEIEVEEAGGEIQLSGDYHEIRERGNP